MKEIQKPAHAAHETLEYQHDDLQWGGRKVTDIEEELSQTPFYAYVRTRMTSRVAELLAAIPA